MPFWMDAKYTEIMLENLNFHYFMVAGVGLYQTVAH